MLAAGPYLIPPGYQLPEDVATVRLPPVPIKRASTLYQSNASATAWGFAVQLVDSLPTSVVLLAGDGSIAVTVGGKFAGIARQRHGDWVWEP